MLKIAVTGASGFIGRHVLAELAHYPVEVIVITRDRTKLENPNNFRVVESDISNPRPNDYMRFREPDILIHLAWQGLPNYKSLHHFETELPMQYLFLKGLIQAGLPSLLVLGTCAEYGMQSSRLSEEMAVFPCTPYGYAKDALRRQLEFLRGDNLLLTWARLFYTYGEGQSKLSLFSQLSQTIAHGEKVFNMSGGKQFRDYLPVVDVASAIVKLAMKQEDIGIVNICSGKPISVRNLVEGWIKDNGWDIKLNLGYYPYPDYEPMSFWGDNGKLKKIIEGTV